MSPISDFCDIDPRFQICRDMLNINKEDVVLDIGCGELAILEKLYASQCHEIIGIDVSLQALRKVKKNIASNIHFLRACATYLPFKKGCMDKIALLEIIEHVPNGRENVCFKEASIVIKKGGFLILSTPNDSGSIINLLDPHWLMGHKHHKPESLKQLSVNNEFKVQTLLTLGGLLGAFCYLLYLPWHLLWSHLLNREEPTMPFQSLMYKLNVLDYSKLGVRSTHIFLKAIKV